MRRKSPTRSGIIDDIAYQTNLLALNAAIEAALRRANTARALPWWQQRCANWPERSQVAAQEISQVAGARRCAWQKNRELLEEMVPSIQRTSRSGAGDLRRLGRAILGHRANQQRHGPAEPGHPAKRLGLRQLAPPPKK